MSDNTPAEQVDISRTELRDLIAGLHRIGKRELSERLTVPTDNPDLALLATGVNELVDALDVALTEDRESTMQLALGMSECFAVLASVRNGDLSARISAETLDAGDELMHQFGTTLNDTVADLETQFETIQRQQNTQNAMENLVRQLQTPILQLWDDVLALPVIGMVDSRRSAEMMETLLNEIVNHRCKYVIIDITGVEIVDTRTADHFIKVMKSAELLGTRCVMTGIRPAVAQTLVELGVELTSIRTLRNLQEGLRDCLRDMEIRKGGATAMAER
jgi:rsbT co-antagonist protein RsbR